MSYTAKTIARFVVDYFYSTDVPITNLKLQKILYYLEADFLVHTGISLFDDDIVAWKYGPVVPNVYTEFRKNGSFEIEENYPKEVAEIDDNTAAAIQKVLIRSKGYSAMELVRKSHKEDPWAQTPQSHPISKTKIKEYYNENETLLI